MMSATAMDWFTVTASLPRRNCPTVGNEVMVTLCNASVLSASVNPKLAKARGTAVSSVPVTVALADVGGVLTVTVKVLGSDGSSLLSTTAKLRVSA